MSSQISHLWSYRTQSLPLGLPRRGLLRRQRRKREISFPVISRLSTLVKRALWWLSVQRLPRKSLTAGPPLIRGSLQSHTCVTSTPLFSEYGWRLMLRSTPSPFPAIWIGSPSSAWPKMGCSFATTTLTVTPRFLARLDWQIRTEFEVRDHILRLLKKKKKKAELVPVGMAYIL